MTALEFRQSPERVAAWRDLLANNQIVAQIIVMLRDEKPSAAVPPGTDAIERVHVLGKLEQHETDVDLLLSAAEPLPPEPVEERALYGADPSQFQTK